MHFSWGVLRCPDCDVCACVCCQIFCKQLGYAHEMTTSNIRMFIMILAIILAVWNYFFAGSVAEAGPRLLFGSF